MEQRIIIDEKIILNIPVAFGHSDYKPGIRWDELIKTKDILPTDIISEIGYREEKTQGFSGGQDDNEYNFYTATLVVIRKRPETDDEFFKRQKEQQNFYINLEEREKLEYLRLKAKYE